MATKKTGKKKTASKTTTRSARTKKAKKEKVPYVPNESRIVYFMTSLINAGYVGKTIPDDNKKKKQSCMNIRQMAQQLDRQVHRTVT